MRQVVVTGVHAITPAGFGAEALWDALMTGRTFAERIERFDTSGNNSRIGAAVRDFDPAGLGLPARIVRETDRAVQFAVASTRCGLRDAGIDMDRDDPRRAGVCIGTAIGGVDSMERAFAGACLPANDKPQWVRVAPGKVGRSVYGAFLASSVSAEVARDLGLCGPCTTMATGCTAGIDAIGAAASLIEAGMADIMVTGGADASLTPIVLTAFDNIKALTRRNERPQKASRPFDRGRDGFLLAEGCAILVLEEEAHARRRGAHLYGRVLGHASRSNAYHMTGLPADGAALAGTIEAGLAQARIDRRLVDHISAHGSSTQQNDRNETAAFKRVYGDRAGSIPISSVKAAIGHSLGAASAIESVVSFLALARGVVPPTLNYEQPCPDCDLDYVPNEPREMPLRVIQKNASGFSGIHTAAFFAQADFRPDTRS